MMKLNVTIASPNSLILLMDPLIGVIPEGFSGALTGATSTCIAVGTACEFDEKTTLTLTDETLQVPSDLKIVYQGLLCVSAPQICLCTAKNDVVLAMPVNSLSLSVVVLANHPYEPNLIRFEVADQ